MRAIISGLGPPGLPGAPGPPGRPGPFGPFGPANCGIWAGSGRISSALRMPSPFLSSFSRDFEAFSISDTESWPSSSASRARNTGEFLIIIAIPRAAISGLPPLGRFSCNRPPSCNRPWRGLRPSDGASSRRSDSALGGFEDSGSGVFGSWAWQGIVQTKEPMRLTNSNRFILKDLRGRDGMRFRRVEP